MRSALVCLGALALLAGCASSEGPTLDPFGRTHMQWHREHMPQLRDRPTLIGLSGPCGAVVRLPEGVDCRKVPR